MKNNFMEKRWTTVSNTAWYTSKIDKREGEGDGEVN